MSGFCLDCGAPLSDEAKAARLMGCGVECPDCMERRNWNNVRCQLDILRQPSQLPPNHPTRAWVDSEIRRLESLPLDYYRLDKMLERAAAPKKYPAKGVITPDDPSIYGDELLGHEGETWESFTRGRELVSHEVGEPYRRGIGAGFGSTEDGDV